MISLISILSFFSFFYTYFHFLSHIHTYKYLNSVFTIITGIQIFFYLIISSTPKKIASHTIRNFSSKKKRIESYSSIYFFSLFYVFFFTLFTVTSIESTFLELRNRQSYYFFFFFLSSFSSSFFFSLSLFFYSVTFSSSSFSLVLCHYKYLFPRHHLFSFSRLASFPFSYYRYSCHLDSPSDPLHHHCY